LIADLEARQKRPDDNYTPPVDNRDTRQPVNNTFDPKQMESLVSSKIQEYELTRTQESNFNTVQRRLQETLGDNYQSVLKKQSSELNLTETEVNDMARRNPKQFFKTFGIDEQPKSTNQQFQTPPRSEQRNDPFAPTASQKRTWSYYQNLKKQNRDAYYDPKTQVQMHQDAITLGDEFKDGDYAVFDNM
jgi:hypothetical protein